MAAPAPSCGAPDTRPEAMPGPKMPSPNRASEASTRAMAWPMFGSWPCRAVTNCVKKPEPMPTITASTITLMPEAMTLPSTRSARNAVLFHRAKGTSTKPARVVSLNSRMVMKSCTARMKKATMTINHATSSTAMVRKLSKKLVKPIRALTCFNSGQAAWNPTPASRPGFNRSSAVRLLAVACSPSPAKERKTMSARRLKLLRMKAKTPT